MAKTKVIDTCCPSPGPYKPTLWLDLEEQDVNQIKGLKVGEEGEFIVKGKIVGLEMRERETADEDNKKMKKRTTGSIRLKDFTVSVMGEETNEFKDLVED